MKKFFVFIVGLFIVGTVFAVGENIPTSKTYVDNAVAQKQNTISANNGVAQVLTNTGAAGTIGTKNIYDSSAAYETQTNSLVTAGTMNTAVQNAIDVEFECVAYNENNECLLLRLAGRGELPSGYTRLEYIESTGTQYIDTGYYPNTNTNVLVKYMIGQDNIGDWPMIFGAGVWQGNEYMQYSLYGSPSNVMYYTYGRIAGTTNGDNDITIRPVNYADTEHTANCGLNGWTLDNQSATSSAQVDPINLNASIYLFARNEDNVNVSHKSKAIIYYFVIYDNGVIARDLIPARRDSDSVLGMYDLVSGTFFTNAGTGDFIAGPVQNLYLSSGTQS